ncbi:ABA4-like family protein [Nakamurella sp. GG22]
MTEALFGLTFAVAAPFWALMILLPSWRWTQRISASPLIALPPLVIYLMVMIPIFPEFWAAVSSPDLDVLRQVLSTSHGAAAVWAQLIAFDLFIGRWMYRDSRARGISPWLISPILLLTIFLSPIGLLAYFAVRAIAVVRQGDSRSAWTDAPVVREPIAR